MAVAAGENVVKVAVFFTDGWANTVEDTLNCPPSTLLNFGGCAPPEAAVGWCSGISFMDPTNGQRRSCGATSFPSQMHRRDGIADPDRTSPTTRCIARFKWPTACALRV